MPASPAELRRSIDGSRARRDIVLDFDSQAGHEQMKRRPALVLSPASFNRVVGLAFVAPIATKPRGHAFEIKLSAGRIRGSIMVHQLKSLDWRARRAKSAGHAPPDVVVRATEIVKESSVNRGVPPLVASRLLCRRLQTKCVAHQCAPGDVFGV